MTIVSGLPSAGIGALLTLQLFRVPLTVIASIGIPMLIGVVKKNAMMMIDFALAEQRQGAHINARGQETAIIHRRTVDY